MKAFVLVIDYTGNYVTDLYEVLYNNKSVVLLIYKIAIIL